MTGLARVGRDIASLLCTLPQFRVAYLGRGGVGRRKFGWTSYAFPEHEQWGENYIGNVWNDFSDGENGIIWSNWDLSRMLWFAGHVAGGELGRFLGPGRNFEKWGYFPVDGEGPGNGDGLPIGMLTTLEGYDRACAASQWGQSTHTLFTDWLPHGIWMDKFNIIPYPRSLSWQAPIINAWKGEHFVVVGCNMSNQARKDWPVAFECASMLKAHYGNRFRFWVHTDTPVRYWNMYALAADYDVRDCVEVTLDLTDEQLALRYSACDCTILPSGGEGFGYPIAESMACGTACVVTDYAAGPELVEDDCKVRPTAYRIDTMHNVKRAVLSGAAFAAKAVGQIEAKRKDWEYRSGELRAQVEHLSWDKLRVVWERWFLDGLR